MELLLASYASSNDEADKALAAPAPASTAVRSGEAGVMHVASSSSSIGGDIFSLLAQRRTEGGDRRGGGG
jgi:hypothetical protein